MKIDHRTVELVLIALSVILTGGIGWSQYQLGLMQSNIALKLDQNQMERIKEQRAIESARAIDNMDLQLMNVAKDFLPDINKTNEEGKISRDVVLTTSQHLQENLKRNNFAQIVSKIIDEQYKSGDSTITPSYKLRIDEIANSDSQNGEWFAVVASFLPTSKKIAEKAVMRFREQSKNEYDFHMWKTKVSNHYAITIDSLITKEKANELVQVARTLNIANDAFTQKNREWTYCPIK